MTRLRKHLTYANVMATIAVFFAVGGGAAYATHLVVRSNDIVDNAVRSVDVRNDNLTGGGLNAADLRASSVGPSEADGLTGLDIADETLGREDIGGEAVRAGELGQVRMVSQSASIPPNGGVGTAVAFCSTGEQLLGGGGRFDFPSGDLSTNAPAFNSSPISWVVQGQNNGNAAQALTAQALCLTP